MRSLYRRLRQEELRNRPASRRTVLSWSLAVPAVTLGLGAVGIRRVLPGGSRFTPAAVYAITSRLSEALDTLISIAWVPRAADVSDKLRERAREAMEPEERRTIYFDTASVDTLMAVFDQFRTAAATQAVLEPALSPSDFLGFSGPITSDFSSHRMVEADEELALTITSDLTGLAGSDVVIDEPIVFRGVFRYESEMVSVEGLTRID